jgi:hypothetical protein
MVFQFGHEGVLAAVYLLELLADGGAPVSIEPLRNPERFNDVITLWEDAA